MKTIFAAAAALVLSSALAVAAEWSKLPAPAELAALDDVTVIDIREPDAYANAHVPGAVNVPYALWRGPKENPGAVIDDETLTRILQDAGLETADRIVITHEGDDQSDFGAAARVYWTLKSAGFGEIAILNGGVEAWQGAGEPLTAEVPDVTPSEETFALSDTYIVDRAGVKAVLDGARDARLVDARPPAFFRGEQKHAAADAPGTLVGAQSLPHTSFFDGESRAIAPAEQASDAAAGLEGDAEIISFCNTGHWAATNWFALSELAGKPNVKLYPESMVGWVNNGGDVTDGK